MNLAFDAEQLQVRDAVRRFLERECPPALVRSVRAGEPAHPVALWAGMAEQGWLALACGDGTDEAAGEPVLLGIVAEELGRVCDPTPFMNCIVSCGGLIRALATDAQKARWIAPLARGELLVSLAMLESASDPDPLAVTTRLEAANGELRVSGRKLFVELAGDAAEYLVTAREAPGGPLRLALVAANAPGVQRMRLQSLAHPHLYEVRFDAVAIDAERLLGSGDAAAALHGTLRRTAALQSAVAAGGAQRVLEMTVAHAKERRQFGRPIGSFQAVQHMLAEVWADVETARLTAWEAISQLGVEETAEARVALARCACSESFVRACLTAHQVFGGMGFMWETDLHLWTRKAKEIEFSCGGTDPWRRSLARTLLKS